MLQIYISLYSTKVLIEIVVSQHFLKMTVGLELVSMVVSLQMVPVVSQSKVTDSIKSLFCLIGVSNNQPPALRCLNLLCQRHRFFGISHIYIQEMSRWVRCSYGKRAGFVDANVGRISETSKYSSNFFILVCLLLSLDRGYNGLKCAPGRWLATEGTQEGLKKFCHK